MSYYEVLLFGHIAAAIVWVGGGIGLALVAGRFGRNAETTALEEFFEQTGWVSTRVFTPAALLVLGFGILLVIEGPWSFDQLWITLGLAGFAASFVTGVFLLKPRADAINAIIACEGGVTGEAATAIRRLFILTRIDYAIVLAVVADMALKPTAADVWALAAMAAAIGAVAALVVRDVLSTSTSTRGDDGDAADIAVRDRERARSPVKVHASDHPRRRNQRPERSDRYA